jgi:asparagine synthase (glutamine-hydrolysing)
MCGFAGLLTSVGLGSDELAAHAIRMSAPLVHRGPDDGGVWTDASSGVAFGFRRLAILDLSPSGHQPMWSPSGRFVMVFNGELYNFSELRMRLEARGHRFRGRSDTEVMLAGFDEWGVEEAVRRFIGMFAIAVWDTGRRELSLVRDRIGKKPLYVYREPGLVTFGSELKALIAGPSFDRVIDGEALASYFRYLYVPAPRSIFRSAIKLLPAHILTVSDPALPLPAPRPYWSLHDTVRAGLENPWTGTDADAVDALDRLMTEAVKCRMVSDVPLGALLSGGIDSSAVVAMMQEVSDRPVKTYTIGFAEEGFDEAAHASQVARHIGTDHTELRLTAEDAHSLVPRLPEVFDEPLADPSQVPTLLVSQLARRQVTVALCGDGGDELFGGYNRYIYGTRMLPRVDRIPRAVRRRLAAGIATVPPGMWDRVHGLAAAVLPVNVPRQRLGERIHKIGALMNAGSMDDMYRSLLSAWQEPADVLGRPSPTTADSCAPPLDAGTPTHLLDRMMLADQTAYLPDDLLAKVDRASMAVSLEVRAPLLDQRLVEFSWRLPRALKIRGGTGKWILRQVLHRRVPAFLVERPKMGFSVPIDRWLRGPLRNWAEPLISPDELEASGLDPRPVRVAWGDLQDGRRSTGAALWAVLMFQAWRQRWAA